jgi:hypothetical protein
MQSKIIKIVEDCLSGEYIDNITMCNGNWFNNPISVISSQSVNNIKSRSI